MDRRRAWIIAIFAAVIAAVVVFWPPTAHALYLRSIAGRLADHRTSYQAAVEWSLEQKTNGWFPLPAEFKPLSKNGSVFLHGHENQRIVCFFVEDDGELVRFLGYVQPPRRTVESLDWVEDDKLAHWTESTIDDHWQMIVALP